VNKDGLVEVFQKLGVSRTRVHATSGNIQISCPLAPWTHEHKSDRSPSCSVKIADGDTSLFKCFACGEAGTLVGLIARLNRLNGGGYEDLMEKVAVQERVDLAQQVERAMQQYNPKAVENARKIEWEAWDEGEIAQWVGKVPKYALERGVSLETCREWQLGFDKPGKRFVFPVRREDGRLVGVTGRAIYDGMEPRYKDYWGFNKSQYLYGEHKIDKECRKLLVVEGFIKLLKLWTDGYRPSRTNIAATMMAMPSEEQLRKIRDLGMDVYLAQDGDWAGRKARERFEMSLKGRVRLFDVKIPDEKGPDDLPAAELAELVEKSSMIL